MAGCGKNEGNENKAEQKNETEKLKIVTTIFAPYDFSKQIVGEDAEITMLLPPGSETHTFEPTPQDIINIHVDPHDPVGRSNPPLLLSLREELPKRQGHPHSPCSVHHRPRPPPRDIPDSTTL